MSGDLSEYATNDQQCEVSHAKETTNTLYISQDADKGVRTRTRNGMLNTGQRSSCAEICVICGDTASGFHCGAFICEACKKFFIRSLKKDTGIYRCERERNCAITRLSRTQCPSCRLQKCRRVGLVKKDGEKMKPSETEAVNIPCKVCGAKSSGFHFGAITCEGCKGFFRRMLKESILEKHQCMTWGQCDITEVTRNVCKNCRYSKCLTVGMSASGSRIGRRTNAIKHATLMEVKNHEFDSNSQVVPLLESITVTAESSTHIGGELLSMDLINETPDNYIPPEYSGIEATGKLNIECVPQSSSQQFTNSSTNLSNYDHLLHNNSDFQKSHSLLNVSGVVTNILPYSDGICSYNTSPTVPVSLRLGHPSLNILNNLAKTTRPSLQPSEITCHEVFVRNPKINNDDLVEYDKTHKDITMQPGKLNFKVDDITIQQRKDNQKVGDITIQQRKDNQKVDNITIQQRKDNQKVGDITIQQRKDNQKVGDITVQQRKDNHKVDDITIQQRKDNHQVGDITIQQRKDNQKVDDLTLQQRKDNHEGDDLTMQQRNDVLWSGKRKNDAWTKKIFSKDDILIQEVTAAGNILDEFFIPFDRSHIEKDDSNKVIFEKMMSLFKHYVPIIIKFVKQIAGFRALDISDRIVLIQHNLHCISVLNIIHRRPKDTTYFLLNPPELAILLQAFSQVQTIIHQYTGIEHTSKHLCLDPTEVLFLTALTITFSDESSCLQDESAVLSLQCDLAHALYAYECRAHTDMPERYATLLLRIGELTLMNTEHQCVIHAIISENPDICIPQLYSELFRLYDTKLDVDNTLQQ